MRGDGVLRVDDEDDNLGINPFGDMLDPIDRNLNTGRRRSLRYSLSTDTNEASPWIWMFIERDKIHAKEQNMLEEKVTMEI